jgi:capsular polysaccharide biosynthesis protein
VAPLGFERIVPGEMPVAAQISAFGAARIIVAAHGAGLTNMIFTPPGAAIVELTSTAIEHMDLFRMLSKSTGHSIQTLCSDDYDVPAQTVNVNADYRVDVQQVRQAVEAALAHTGD